jgi:hypothetical protein
MHPRPLAQDNSLEMGLILRSAIPLLDLVKPIRTQVAQMDKQLPVTHVYAMDQIIYASTTTQRFALILVLLSSTIALALWSASALSWLILSVNERENSPSEWR